MYQRQWLLVRLPIALCACVAVAVIWLAWFPIPSQQLRITTGAQQGVYYAYGQRYAETLAGYGVTLEVIASAGTVENLETLKKGGADLALVQGGFGGLPASLDAQGKTSVQTLANVDIEPVWIFTKIRSLESIAQLQGPRVSMGPVGSGSRAVALKLLELARLEPKDLVLSPVTGMGLVAALKNDSLDVAIFVSAPESAVITAMLSTPGVVLAHLKRAAGVTEQLPYLESRLLLQGTLDPNGKQPPKDISILSTTASLVSRQDLDPAMKRLAAATAQQVHDKAGMFHKRGEFPNLKQLDFPVAPEARKTLTRGLPWLERHLSFWWAQVALRLLLIALPILLAALCLAHLVPSYLRWLLESRVNRWYGELKYIEHDLAKDSLSGLDLTKYNTRLQRIEADMSRFATPKVLMQRFYILYQHIAFVRTQLYKLRGR